MARSGAPASPRRRIIDLLLAGPARSRADLARLTRLNKPTITTTVARLIDEGIVQEIGAGESTGGRKPILLSLRGLCRLTVGVEIDAAECRLLLVSLQGERLGLLDLPLTDRRVDGVIETIATGVETLLVPYDRATLLGCGVAVPGLVDLARDTVDSAARLGWEGVALRPLLAARLGVPVMVTDRGKAAGLGELWVLRKERPHDLIYLYLGRGVAGAIVLGHEIHWGASYIAGEIGHMTVDPTGPPCTCGSRGCLESLVSTAAIGERARRLQATDLDGARSDLAAIGALGAAARAGDAAAVAVVAETARWLGLAIANLVNLLNPAVVVLGGPTADWGEPLVAAIEGELARWALPLSRHAARVVVGQARELAVPLGAAALVLQRAGELLAVPGRRTASRGVGRDVAIARV